MKNPRLLNPKNVFSKLEYIYVKNQRRDTITL